MLSGTNDCHHSIDEALIRDTAIQFLPKVVNHHTRPIIDIDTDNVTGSDSGDGLPASRLQHPHVHSTENIPVPFGQE